jgi:hypothetical protein
VLGADDERLRKPLGLILNGVVEVDAEIGTVPEESVK